MGITVLPQAATIAGLVDGAPPAKPLSTPASTVKLLEVAVGGLGANHTGLWECTPGSFQRTSLDAEVMHILAGSMSFQPTGGETFTVRAGDSLFFPANTLGTWTVHETVRKLYVVIPETV